MMDRPPAARLAGLSPLPSAAGPQTASAWVNNPWEIPLDGQAHQQGVSLDPAARAIEFAFGAAPSKFLGLQVVGSTTGIDYAARAGGVGVDQKVLVRVDPSLDAGVTVIVTTVPGGGMVALNVAFLLELVDRPLLRDTANTLLATESLAPTAVVTKAYTVPEGDNALVLSLDPGSNTTLQVSVSGVVSGRLYYATPGTSSEVTGVPVVAQVTDPRDLLVAGGVAVAYSLGATGNGQKVRVFARWLWPTVPQPWQRAKTITPIKASLAIGGTATVIAAGTLQRYLHGFFLSGDAAPNQLFLRDLTNHAEIAGGKSTGSAAVAWGDFDGAPVPGVPGNGVEIVNEGGVAVDAIGFLGWNEG